MKKIFLIATIIILIVAFFLFGKGIGLGSGFGKGKVDGKYSVVQVDSESVKTEKSKETEDSKEQDKIISEKQEDNCEAIEVSVVAKDYFFENERISLDDLISTIVNTDGEFVVEVTDDNASLKAYKKLIDALDDLEISYIEE